MSTMPTIPQPMMYQSHPATNTKGSFGPVFAVLSVISFLALVACLVSRFCTRKISRSKLDTLDQHYDSESDLEKGGKGFGIDFTMVKPSSHEVSQNRKGDFEIKFLTVKSNMMKDPRGVVRPNGGNNIIHPDLKNNVDPRGSMRPYGGNHASHPNMKNNMDPRGVNMRPYGSNNVIHTDMKNNGVCHETGGRRFQGKNMM